MERAGALARAGATTCALLPIHELLAHLQRTPAHRPQDKALRHGGLLHLRRGFELPRQLTLEEDSLSYVHVSDGGGVEKEGVVPSVIHFDDVHRVAAMPPEPIMHIDGRTGERRVIGKKPSKRWKIVMKDAEEPAYEFVAATTEARDAWVYCVRTNLNAHNRRALSTALAR